MLANNSKACGVSAKGPHRIQYDLMLDGARYRPTLPRIPTEANLNRARAHLEDIKARIKAGTFIFEEEFPDYRHMERVIDPSQIRTCNQVFDQFLEHCEARLARHDLAASTLSTYRRILDNLFEIYRDKLTAALESILGNPASGHASTELPETHCVYPVGSHVIVYRVQADVIGVIRILHKRMSLPLNV